MFRSLAFLLILCLVSAGLDAATHVGAFRSDKPNAAHEAHAFHASPDAPDSPAPHEKTHHFCHCAAHSPAAAFLETFTVPFGSSATDVSTDPLLGASRLPPPLRPPNAA
jgi:hypothetical protein